MQTVAKRVYEALHNSDAIFQKLKMHKVVSQHPPKYTGRLPFPAPVITEISKSEKKENAKSDTQLQLYWNIRAGTVEHSTASVRKVCSRPLLTIHSEAVAIKVVLQKRKIPAAMPIHAKELKRITVSVSLSSVAGKSAAQCFCYNPMQIE